MSQRIKVIRAEGLWAPRLGCEGVIVDRPSHHDGGSAYPWPGLGKNEVVILLDDDPLAPRADVDFDRRWSCAIGRDGIEFLP